MPTEINTQLRSTVKNMTIEGVENIIKQLEVTHAMFNNWLAEKTTLGNKKLNQLKHIITKKK